MTGDASRRRGSARRPARLARFGFTDPTKAAKMLASVGLEADRLERIVVGTLAEAPDPDLALTGLVAVIEATEDRADLLEALTSDDAFRRSLVFVLGTSRGLAEHLARHSDHWRDLADERTTSTRPSVAALRADLLEAVGAVPTDEPPVASGGDERVLDRLRVAYRRRVLSLAARDLVGMLAVDDVAAELADLAGAALEAGLAIARAELVAGDEPVRLAVIGMGKCGGRELNYVSDVDVVFVAEPFPGGDTQAAMVTGAKLAALLTRACSRATAEGSLWEVDAGLRPEGNAGPLVRTLESHLAYYGRWAKTWEFQALLKARPVAGDVQLGQDYVDRVLPKVWESAARDGFVDDVQQMRRRVELSVPTAEGERQLKLGPGGLRDVEFAVQLLQLVHGRADPSLRSRTTMLALDALAAGGYVGREDAASLASAYRFLRTLEHRLQLYRLRRTHLMPDRESDLRRLGRSIGLRANPVDELIDEWRRHAREVRRLHEKLFYRPLLNAVARLNPDDARLSPAAAMARLVALGYTDPEGALRHLEALSSGVSRRASIQRTLLPVMLGWFAETADPDAGLLGFRRVSDALGRTHWYLAMLRDGGASAQRLAHLLGSSRYATDLLLRAPEAVTMLADDSELRARSLTELSGELRSATSRQGDAEQAIVAVRAIRRRELFRVATADALGLLDVEAVGEALATITVSALAAGLDTAVRAVESDRGDALPVTFAIIAMGRLGGAEMSYGSDADVVFVHEPLPGVDDHEATKVAQAVANELLRLFAKPGADPPLGIDTDLRPEGRGGPLVRSLGSYASYYRRWSSPWESQALLRAEPIAGDTELGSRFVQLVDRVRYPTGGLSDVDVVEIRRLKARIEAERLPKNADPALHTKLGRGGLADIEWTAQLLQLRHAASVPALRTTRTLGVLRAVADEGLLAADDVDALVSAWRLASRVRNAIMLVRGKADDSLPRDLRDLTGLARMVGYAPGAAGALPEDYRRTTRRARAVVERVFYA